MSLSRNKSIFLSALLCASIFSSAMGDTCKNRVFSIKVSDSVTIGEILNQLSDECNFSVINRDANAKKMLDENVSGINVKDMTISEIFDILIEKNNLNYDYNNDVLSISSTKTKTFKIDYITSIREGRATTKASVDSAPIELDNLDTQRSSGSSIDDQDNIIKTTEKFDFWEKLNLELKALLNNGADKIIAPDPIINANAGLVTITGTSEQLKRIENYIADLEKSLKKQVMLDVSILSIQLNNEFKRGIDWTKFNLGFNSYYDGKNSSGFSFGRRSSNSTPFAGHAYTVNPVLTNSSGELEQKTFNYPNAAVPSMKGITGGFILGGGFTFNLDGMLNFLETKGKAKVVSSPKVMTMNNQQAMISVGDNINYQIADSQSDFSSDTTSVEVTQYSIFIGILLNILPEISDDNKIMLRINPSLSTFKYQSDDVKQETIRKIAPDTLQKKLSTVVQVNSGDTIVLGGLISEQTGKDITKVPVLGDIPVIGYLFKSIGDSLATTELVFVITPKIVDLNNIKPIKESLKDLGFFGTMYE